MIGTAAWASPTCSSPHTQGLLTEESLGKISASRSEDLRRFASGGRFSKAPRFGRLAGRGEAGASLWLDSHP